MGDECHLRTCEAMHFSAPLYDLNRRGTDEIDLEGLFTFFAICRVHSIDKISAVIITSPKGDASKYSYERVPTLSFIEILTFALAPSVAGFVVTDSNWMNLELAMPENLYEFSLVKFPGSAERIMVHPRLGVSPRVRVKELCDLMHSQTRGDDMVIRWVAKSSRNIQIQVES
jgi:hypothetical protein